jgi:hypothetical protein
VVAALAGPAASRADESELPSVGVTETFLVERHGFNQDRRADNDDYWDLKSRLNLSSTAGPYTAGLRIDDVVYFSPPDGTYRDDQRVERFSLRADGRLASVTAGDFYVQVGRGIALALRKIDELGVDVALRGGRLDLHLPGRWETSLFAGTTNITNVDEVNRRVVPDPRDRILGGRTELTLVDLVTVGTHGVVLVPGIPSLPEEGDDHIGNAGLDLDVPEIPGGLHLHLEGDLQWRNVGGSDPAEGRHPHQPLALYGDVGWTAGPLSLTVELKDYYDFQPLEGAVDPFSGLPYTYTQPPTAERSDQQVPSTRNIIGGRLRADLRIPGTPHAVFANVMHARTRKRDVDEDDYVLVDDTLFWHAYAGGELRLNGERTVGQASGGLRLEDDAESGDNLRRLVHAEVDVQTPVVGPWGMHVSWIHESWRQHNPVETRGDITYHRGTAVLEADYGSLAAAAIAFEYDDEVDLPGVRRTFWFGDARWNVTSNVTLHVVVGQQRGGLKCVNGVCRTFPPFAGGRAEVVVRY